MIVTRLGLIKLVIFALALVVLDWRGWVIALVIAAAYLAIRWMQVRIF